MKMKDKNDLPPPAILEGHQRSLQSRMSHVAPMKPKESMADGTCRAPALSTETPKGVGLSVSCTAVGTAEGANDRVGTGVVTAVSSTLSSS